MAIADVNKITAKTWQHKRDTIGAVVFDIEDIKQCIRTICTTQKGSVPFASEFGCEIMAAIGENTTDSINYLTTVYLKEIPKQEPRCEVIDIAGEYDEDGRIKMKVYYKYKFNQMRDKIEVYV